MLFNGRNAVFGTVDAWETMVLKNIKHGRGYSRCDYYPEGCEEYPGHIKVSTETREIVEHEESDYPGLHRRYAHYAKREILKLRAEHDHRKEHTFSWRKDPYSDF